MPIYLKFDGVDGSVSSRHTGGMNVCMADGSVKFIKYSTAIASGGFAANFTGGVSVPTGNSSPGGGPRVVAFDGSTKSGEPNAIEVSKIISPDSPLGFDLIDSHDADAVGKTRTLFNAAGGVGLTHGLVVSITRAALSEAARRAQNTNNLKQLGLASIHRRIPALQLLVCDTGNSNVLVVEMKNVLITSFQTSGHGDAVHNFPTKRFSINFAAVRCYP